MMTLYMLAYLGVIIFLITLAWRAVKALEKSAKAQTDIAEALRQLVISKSKEENR